MNTINENQEIKIEKNLLDEKKEELEREQEEKRRLRQRFYDGNLDLQQLKAIEQKRNAFRVSYDNEATIYEIKGNDKEFLAKAKIRDISDGGISLWIENFWIPANSEILIHIEFDGNEADIISIVRHISPKFVGLAFKEIQTLIPEPINLNKEFHRRIVKFIFLLQSRKIGANKRTGTGTGNFQSKKSSVVRVNHDDNFKRKRRSTFQTF